jgi:hypothetical protein
MHGFYARTGPILSLCARASLGDMMKFEESDVAIILGTGP